MVSFHRGFSKVSLYIHGIIPIFDPGSLSRSFERELAKLGTKLTDVLNSLCTLAHEQQTQNGSLVLNKPTCPIIVNVLHF